MGEITIFPPAKPANFRKILGKRFYNFDRTLKMEFHFEGDNKGLFTIRPKGSHDFYCGAFNYGNDQIIDGQAFMYMYCSGFYITHEYKVMPANHLQHYDYKFEMDEDLVDIKILHIRESEKISVKVKKAADPTGHRTKQTRPARRITDFENTNSIDRSGTA